MNRDYMIVCNEHKALIPGTLLFWGELTGDGAPRSFGGYTCRVDRCERYTRDELETWRGDLKKEYPFFDEINPTTFQRHGEGLATLEELQSIGYRFFSVMA